MSTDFMWRLLLASALGAAIGVEREYRHKPAGLRTNILIAVGSALFAILSISLGHAGGGHFLPLSIWTRSFAVPGVEVILTSRYSFVSRAR